MGDMAFIWILRKDTFESLEKWGQGHSLSIACKIVSNLPGASFCGNTWTYWFSRNGKFNVDKCNTWVLGSQEQAAEIS